MSKTLADIFGWEEGAVYKVGELYYSVVGENLYYFKDFESPRIKTNQNIIIDLLELVNEAERVEHKKYYLKHKFLDREGVNYLNYNYSTDRLYIIGRTETRYYQTEFTEDEIEEIEAAGFNLCNFERVEVKDE